MLRPQVRVDHKICAQAAGIAHKHQLGHQIGVHHLHIMDRLVAEGAQLFWPRDVGHHQGMAREEVETRFAGEPPGRHGADRRHESVRCHLLMTSLQPGCRLCHLSEPVLGVRNVYGQLCRHEYKPIPQHPVGRHILVQGPWQDHGGEGPKEGCAVLRLRQGVAHKTTIPPQRASEDSQQHIREGHAAHGTLDGFQVRQSQRGKRNQLSPPILEILPPIQRPIEVKVAVEPTHRVAKSGHHSFGELEDAHRPLHPRAFHSAGHQPRCKRLHFGPPAVVSRHL
mmetsp:Transcript_2394/g.5409  ORF Transcript_2394/g.5409 Transcript_2394/m.5409 type:complete len:281 (-) Transcript_2394:727-1569(-)